MKKILLAAALVAALVCCAVVLTSGQVTLADSLKTVSIQAYAGILGANQYRLDTTRNTLSGTLRLGGGITARVTNKTSLIGWSYWENGSFVTSLGMRLQLQKWAVVTGDIPTPAAALLRPLPITQAGQFEVTAQARIAGKAPGLRIARQWTSLSLMTGIYIRNFRPEYHLAAELGDKWKFASWIRTGERQLQWGAAAEYCDGKIDLIASAKNGEAGGFIGTPMPGMGKVRFFLDYGRYLPEGQESYWKVQTGLLRNWQLGRYVRAKVAASWTLDPRAVNLYLMITL